MAKVVAPLQSFSASGKVGKSIVFFSHLGRNIVRGLVTPMNPQTETQGDSRLLLGALGRSAHAVSGISIALPAGSDYYQGVTSVVPAGQTWVSSLIKTIINIYGTGNTGVAALQAAADAASATNWEAQAATLGLTDLTISYAKAGDTTITAGAQLFALAKNAVAIHASNPSVLNVVPVTTANVGAWTSANVVSFKALLNAAA